MKMTDRMKIIESNANPWIPVDIRWTIQLLMINSINCINLKLVNLYDILFLIVMNNKWIEIQMNFNSNLKNHGYYRKTDIHNNHVILSR